MLGLSQIPTEFGEKPQTVHDVVVAGWWLE